MTVPLGCLPPDLDDLDVDDLPSCRGECIILPSPSEFDDGLDVDWPDAFRSKPDDR